MAPTMQGVCSACKTAADNITPVSLMHWEHDIGGEGGGGEIGEAMVQTKPRQWLQRAEAYPFKQKEDFMCVLTWGVRERACNNISDFVAVIITIISLKQQICVLCVAGSKWSHQHTGKPTQILDTTTFTYVSQLPSCCLTEIPISELSVHVCWVVLFKHVVCLIHDPAKISSSAALLGAIERAIKTNI
eukprot:6431859-Ditylum_brightwellii.AAC.1